MGDQNLTFITGFRTTSLKGTITLRIDKYTDEFNLDDLLSWAYKENIVGLMFRTRDNKGCARIQFTKDDCVELVRKLTEILQKTDNKHS
jgi:hypothetical protein